MLMMKAFTKRHQSSTVIKKNHCRRLGGERKKKMERLQRFMKGVEEGWTFF